jgi:integrase
VEKLHYLLLAVGVDPSGFSGHSFRRGAASTAMAVGIPYDDIMRLGRWKSNSIDRYFSDMALQQNLISLSKQLHSQPGPSASTPVQP